MELGLHPWATDSCQGAYHCITPKPCMSSSSWPCMQLTSNEHINDQPPLQLVVTPNSKPLTVDQWLPSLESPNGPNPTLNHDGAHTTSRSWRRLPLVGKPMVAREERQGSVAIGKWIVRNRRKGNYPPPKLATFCRAHTLTWSILAV